MRREIAIAGGIVFTIMIVFVAVGLAGLRSGGGKGDLIVEHILSGDAVICRAGGGVFHPVGRDG